MSFVGKVEIKDSSGASNIILDGDHGDIVLHDLDGNQSVSIRGKAKDSYAGYNYTGLWVGASEGKKPGRICLRDSEGKDSLIIDGHTRTLEFHDNQSTGVIISGTQKRILILDDFGNESIMLDGNTGDVSIKGADCAEDFDTFDSEALEPGTVMVIEQNGKLRQSNIEYDKKVAGVISRGGDYKPGLVLDKKQSSVNRNSISLIGKVYCKVDAQYSPIEVGDLLTTSNTAGHAMKVKDPLSAFGAVIGKALSSLNTGKGLIPILVALQ